MGTPNADLAATIARYRARRGLTLAALGSRVGLSRAAIHQIEQRQSDPSLASLREIAIALGLSPTVLGAAVLRRRRGGP